MPMISVIAKNRRITDVLLDGGLGVNIISDHLRRKLDLQKLELAPFTIKMADQRRVTPLGIMRNFKIDIGGFKYFITATVIKMEHNDAGYSMLLGRPWLKQAEAHQDWGRNQLTLTQGGETISITSNQAPHLAPSKRPTTWESYDWINGLSNEEEEIVYMAMPYLQLIWRNCIGWFEIFI